LEEKDLKSLYDYAKSLSLEILVEVHDLAELRIAEKIDAEIIGVNNRNLKTFSVDLQNSIDLAKEFSTNALHISESGIKTADDVQKISDKFDGILVGEALMVSGDIAGKVAELKVCRK
jgi:indole-3-glycerol phosphate synthase